MDLRPMTEHYEPDKVEFAGSENKRQDLFGTDSPLGS